MNIISYPERFLWSEILKRPTLNHDALRETDSSYFISHTD